MAALPSGYSTGRCWRTGRTREQTVVLLLVAGRQLRGQVFVISPTHPQNYVRRLPKKEKKPSSSFSATTTTNRKNCLSQFLPWPRRLLRLKVPPFRAYLGTRPPTAATTPFAFIPLAAFLSSHSRLLGECGSTTPLQPLVSHSFYHTPYRT